MKTELTISEDVATQFLKVRDTARTNMLDRNGVQRVAAQKDWHALVLWIEDSDEGDLATMVMRGTKAVSVEMDDGREMLLGEFEQREYHRG